MIATIRLENFQSHKDTILELHPGINAIVGASDKGKSSILRGLLWAVENRPSGDAHVSDWCKTDKGTIKPDQVCRVTVTKNDGSTCSRIRSAKMNGYMVGETKVEAIKTDVPQEVNDFFNMSEVNIQRQRDIDFLISKSPGDVAKFFNKLINLEVIDKVLSLAEGKKRASTATCKGIELNLDTSRKELERLSWVSEAQALVKVIEGLQSEMSKLSVIESGLGASISQLVGQMERSAAFSWIEEAQKSVVLAKKTAEGLASTANQYNTLTTLTSALVQAKKSMAELGWVVEVEPIVRDTRNMNSELVELLTNQYDLSTLISAGLREKAILDRIPTEEPAALLKKVSSLHTRFKNLDQEVEELASLISLTVDHFGKIAENQKLAKTLISKRPPTCPLCGGDYIKHNQ